MRITRKAMTAAVACSAAFATAGAMAPVASAASVGQLCYANSVTGTGFSIAGYKWVPNGSLVRLLGYPTSTQYEIRYDGVVGNTNRQNVTGCYWQ